MELDLIWLFMKLLLTLFWVVVVILAALFMMHFKPIRNFLKKHFHFDFELF